ncbi:hypothetical protein, partial [Burkholderia cenocepacia]|uniref:hypothetical protein n=1 Tax=Burkholderia cenocepacia TaxID=95486 RepID=UPI001BA23267
LFLVRFISAVLLSGSWSWKPDFLGFLGNRRLQPSTTPGTLPVERQQQAADAPCKRGASWRD